MLDKDKLLQYNKIIKGKRDDKMITLQFTLVSTTGQYKPMSTLLQVPSLKEYNANSQEYKNKAIRKMCIQRHTDGYYLKKYGYTHMKIRVFDKEKIAKENAERYERIKKEKGWV